MVDIDMGVTNFNNPYCPVAVPPDAVIWSDNFNRTDAAVLGSTPIGSKPWTVVTSSGGGVGSAKISNNAAGVTSTVNANRVMAHADAGVSAGKGRAVVRTLAAAPNTAGLVPSAAGPIDYLFFQPAGGTFVWSLYSRVANSGVLVPGGATSVVAAPGDVIEWTIRNNKYNGWINGTKVLTDLDLSGVTAALGNKQGFVGTTAGANVLVNLWEEMSFVTPGEWLVGL